MVNLVLWRLLQIIPMIWLVATALFFLLNLVPGGPLVALTGEFADADTVNTIRERLGLNERLHIRYWRFLSLLATGDLGQSYAYGRPVAEVIQTHLPATLILALPALVLAAFIGVPIGILAARTGMAGNLLIFAALVFFAIPVFWLGHMLRLGFSWHLHWLPVQGITNPRYDLTGWSYYLDVIRHAILPWTTLLLHQLAFTVLITRASMRQEKSSQYFTTALSKGLTQWRAETRHALPNAAAPILTLFGNRIGWLVGGSILIETVFAWPGLGQLVGAAIQNRDYPLIIGVLLTGTVISIIGNLLADIAMMLTDPRPV